MLYFKSLHIIFVVTWFAGLFYIVRLFIYNTEAEKLDEPSRNILRNQYQIMIKRLWLGITVPSSILTLIFGLNMLQYWPLSGNSWLHVKLFLVFLLYLYHLSCWKIYRMQIKQGIFKYSSNQLRIWNEVATLFLISIVFLVVVKSSLSMLWGVLGLILFAAILMLAIRIYRKIRKG